MTNTRTPEADRELLEIPVNQVSIEQCAKLFMKGYRRSVVAVIRQNRDPALFALQVGLAIGVLMDNPKNAYHQLRSLLAHFPVKQD